MPSISFSERVRVSKLAADKTRRRTVSRVLNSRLLRWRYGSSIADQLLIVPQDLRTTDPSFWQEIELGQFGLSGCLAVVDDTSPFDVRPPSVGWQRVLHGFGWLRHLAAVENPEARATARQLVVDWIGRNRNGAGIAWDPEIAGRRLISWISHANLLLEDATPKTYDLITASLGFQIVRLSATWRDAPPGLPRLTALIAVTLADLSVDGHQNRLGDAERMLSDELSIQIFPDGGHVSRNPAVLVDLMLDLLPLSQCFVARKRKPPEALTTAIQRMLTMLRFMRMGDGLLARFNGTGVGSAAGLATVLTYDDIATTETTLPKAPQSGYVRLTGGDAIVIADVGCPPALEYAGEAHAGALAIEFSVGKFIVLANGGAPGLGDDEWRNASRATSAHNTLQLGEKSSSKMVRHKLLHELVGSYPIRFPNKISFEQYQTETGSFLKAQHDGYLQRFGLLHHRELTLSKDGLKLDGMDRIAGPSAPIRLAHDLPFAIHFHLHPDVKVNLTQNNNQAALSLPDGSKWRMVLEGAQLNIEESVHFADTSGATRSQQIVLRGATFGDSTVRWSMFAE